MASYLSVWDVCSRNAIFTTGTGVSDNHGNAWGSQSNNFLTWAWAADLSQGSLLAALAAGRCFFADMVRFRGTLDLLVDGVAPIGSVSVSDLTSRTLVVSATGLPSSGTVRLVTGPVDVPGPGVPFPATTVRSFPVSAVASGSMSIAVDATNPVFVRVEIWDSSNRLLAGSNPVWLLRTPPDQRDPCRPRRLIPFTGGGPLPRCPGPPGGGRPSRAGRAPPRAPGARRRHGFRTRPRPAQPTSIGTSSRIAAR